MVTQLTEGVYWVGVADWGIRHFHGFELSTHRGSIYNAYLIVDEKVVLVDTVWGPFQDQLIENIREIVDPARIDIVVANHAEMDHSGDLPAVMRHCPDFSDRVLKKIDEVLALDLPAAMIAPSHGVIWRREPLQIVRKYQEWAAQAPERSAVIIGSPTFNMGLLPTITPILEDLKGLKFKNKIGAAFGSYGWSGESVKIIEDHLARCKIDVVAPGVRAKWQPKPPDLDACEKLGRAVAQAVEST